MTWRAATVILSALLCVMISSALTAGVGDLDRTSLHWNSELVSNHRLRSAESTKLHLYTREEADNNTASPWNCSQLYDSSYGYNESSCRFVRENCRAKAHLFDYLAFMSCDMPQNIRVHWLIKWCGIIYIMWYYLAYTFLGIRVHISNYMVYLPHLSPCYNSKLCQYLILTLTHFYYYVGRQFLRSSIDISSRKVESVSQHRWNHSFSSGKWSVNAHQLI